MAELPENPNELYLEDDKGRRVATGLPRDQLEHVVARGGQVAVTNPRGEAGTIPVADLKEALGAGYRLEARPAHGERVLEQKYGDSPVKSFLEGAARTVTFGLSDVLLEPAVGKEALRERRARNPGAAMVGEVAGAISPIGAPAATNPSSGSSTARLPTRVGTSSTERLRFQARRMNPFSWRFVRCLCTVASEDRLKRRPISSRLGA